MPAFLQTKQYLISKQEMTSVIHYGKFYVKKKAVLLKGNSLLSNQQERWN